MPVWHEATKALREEGKLRLIGITQEQHPDRCRLFAQWKGLDWPILWDPFNLTGSSVVPNFTAIDEHGVVRIARLSLDRPDQLREFLEAEFEAPADLTAKVTLTVPAPISVMQGADSSAFDRALLTLEKIALGEKGSARDLFRSGVAYRLRYDSPATRSGDFQAAIDLWTAALAREPNQYIWRRRLQQYGPRLDKPYPFYGWIEQARRDLEARGESPAPIAVPLSFSERAAPVPRGAGGSVRDAGSGADALPPDPEGRIQRDAGLVGIETATAFDTSQRRERGTACVHVLLRPAADKDVHWSNDAGGVTVWVDPPAGWRVQSRRFELAAREAEVSSEPRLLDFELARDPAAEPGEGQGVLRGYALYYVCEGAGGACLYLRQDFAVSLR